MNNISNGVYSIYSIRHSPEGLPAKRFVGRIIISEQKLEILEDHYGIIDRLFTEGPLNGSSTRDFLNISSSPYYLVERDLPESTDEK